MFDKCFKRQNIHQFLDKPRPVEKQCLENYVERWGYYNEHPLCSFNGSHSACKSQCDSLGSHCDSYQYSAKYQRCMLIKWKKSPLSKKNEEFVFCTKGNNVLIGKVNNFIQFRLFNTVLGQCHLFDF